MALTVTTDLTNITTAEADTNWGDIGTQSAALEPDFFVQGSNCLSRAVSGNNTKKGMAFDFGSAIDFTTSTHQDKLVYIWMRVNTPQLIKTRANGGLIVRLCTTDEDTDYREWYVGGSDTIPDTEGWICYVIDPQSAGSATSGSYSAASVQFFGGTIETTTTAKGQNFGIDRISYGRGEIYVSGTTATAGEGFKEIAAVMYDSAATNRWGNINVRSGVIYVKGKIIIGHATANTTFTSQNETVVFETPSYDDTTNIVKTIPDAGVGAVAGTDGLDSYNGLAIQGGSGTTTIDFGVIVGTDAGRSGTSFSAPPNDDLSTPGSTTATVAVDNSTMGLSMYACSFNNMEGIIDLNGTGVDDDDCFSCTFSGCGRIDSNMEFCNCNILNSVASVTDGAVIWGSTTNIHTSLFANNSRAIVYEATTGTPFTYTDIIFSGNTFDIRNESGGAITVNWSGGTLPVAEDIGGGSATTLTNTVTVTFTGMKDNTEVRIYDTGDDSVIDGIENATAGSADDRSFAWSDSAANNVYYMIHSETYETIRVEGYVVPSVNTEVAVQQRFDRNFSNP